MPDPLLHAARDLYPLIRSAREEIEESRQLPHQVAEALEAAGLFRMLVPARIGGRETDPVTACEVIEEVSRADGAAGWSLAVAAGQGYFASYLPEDAARIFYAGTPGATVGSATPPGIGEVVEGGFRVTGNWNFSSGVPNVAWAWGAFEVRRRGSFTPELRMAFFRPEEVLIMPGEHPVRRITAHRFSVNDVFVPTDRTAAWGAPLPEWRTPLYRMPFELLSAAGIASISLGIGRAAIDELVGVAATADDSENSGPMRDSVMTQLAAADAEATLGSARAYLHEQLDVAWRTVLRGDRPAPSHQARLVLAATNAANAARAVVDRCVDTAGSCREATSHILERCVRDVRSASQHHSVQPANREFAGRVLLGLGLQ